MQGLSVLLLVVAVVVQAVPENAIPLRRLIPMRKTKPLARGHPEPPKSGGRIINGSPAVQGQFPHQAGVIMDNAYQCGGSLISPSAVLSAGHCASTYRSWVIYLGGTTLSGSEAGRVTISTTSATVHSQYNPRSLQNDVSVIFLGTDVQLSDYIQVVNLPSRSQAGNTFEGEIATVSGWGYTADGSGVSPVLRYFSLPVMSNSECEPYFQQGTIFSSTLCASSAEGRSICSGDSGGPLVLGSSGSYTLIGVVSFVSSAGCQTGYYPSGYARVTSFLDWISNTAGITIP